MLHDLRYAIRTIRRSPAFAASAILALALGIGANTAVFSVVYAVLLKPLPYAESARLVRLYEGSHTQGIERGDLSPGTFVDWRARSRTLESVGLHTRVGDSLWSFGERFEIVKTSAVSPVLFPMLRVAPVLGRTFRPEIDQETPYGDSGEVVISHGLWQRQFGGRADVVGRAIQVEGRFPLRIIGVMPRGFAFPEGTEAWTNLAFLRPVGPGERQTRYYQSIARLAAGVSLADARAELAALSAQLELEQPRSNAGWTAHVEPLAESATRTSRPALLALAGAVIGVLLIGCANVAGLLIARATARRRELALRVALGAGVARLVRQSAIEALVLAALGASAGLVLGHWIARVLVRMAPPDVPRLSEVGMDGPVLLFAAAAGLASAMIVGAVPAMQAGRGRHESGLRHDGRASTRRGSRIRQWLIAGEVAVVVLLLTASALLVRSFVKLQAVDLGFVPQRVLIVEMRWPTGRFVTPSRRPWFLVQQGVDTVVGAVRALPGVEAAGMITDVPLSGEAPMSSMWLAGAAGASGTTPPVSARDQWKATISIVTPGYFTAMTIPLLRGRHFVDADRFSEDELTNPDTPRPQGVAIVNSAFAARYFPGQDPLGRRVVLFDDQTYATSRVIVGISADVRAHVIGEAPAPCIFLPHAQHPGVFRPNLVIRSALPPETLAAAVRERLRDVDPRLLVLRTRTMNEVISGSLSRPRFNLLLLGAFALIALDLAAIGIYGVVSFLVVQRTREIGIRMALGARAGDVLWLVLRQVMGPVLIGAAAGIAGAIAAGGTMRGLLFEIDPVDPVSFAIAPILLTLVALGACYVPARRATRIDPLIALQED